MHHLRASRASSRISMVESDWAARKVGLGLGSFHRAKTPRVRVPPGLS